jgi:hypothetical protein
MAKFKISKKLDKKRLQENYARLMKDKNPNLFHNWVLVSVFKPPKRKK